MTGVQLVQAVGRCYGQRLTPTEADRILWNHTGYPSFWMTDKPVQELRHQAAAYLRGERHCARCGVRDDALGDGMEVCTKCDKEMAEQCPTCEGKGFEVAS